MSEEIVGGERPFRGQDIDPDWNREPGIVPVPGSNYSKELTKFEQFHSKWTIGTQPGNPYKYRPFPKMVYRAERFHGTGKVACMAAPPDPVAFSDNREYERMEQASIRFTERCQLTVKDERELQKALEAGYRESPDEAVKFAEQRDRDVITAAAHREYEDRGISDAARREVDAATAAHGEPVLAEVPEARRGPGRPRKDQTTQ